MTLPAPARLPLIAALLCILALLFAACDNAQPTPAPAPIATPTSVSPTQGLSRGLGNAALSVPITATPEVVPPTLTPTARSTYTPDPPTNTPQPEDTASPTRAATATRKPKLTATRTRTRTPVVAATATAEEAATPVESEKTATGVPPSASEVTPTISSLAAEKGYEAYIPAATKKHQDYHFSCEFDAAWVVFKTYGFDVSVDEQISIMGVDKSIEPRWEETKQGIFIYGGDITNYYSGDYKTNFLARSSGSAMRKVFEHFGLRVTPVHDRAGIEKALLSGSLVWVKVPVDFKTWRPATWVMPDGRTYQTVLGNDHAVTLMGFNENVVVVRDVLGPTSSNWNRKYEYEVPWDKFLSAWGAQSYDGLAVAPPETGK